jgi:hypothetical protein
LSGDLRPEPWLLFKSLFALKGEILNPIFSIKGIKLTPTLGAEVFTYVDRVLSTKLVKIARTACVNLGRELSNCSCCLWLAIRCWLTQLVATEPQILIAV